MSDRELLEKAARAAGYVVDGYVDDMIVQPPKEKAGGLVIRNEQGGHSLWNAEEDDGDALRLAVKLRMDVKQWNSLAIATKAWNRHAEENTSTQCPYAATRRAIVRAAAAIHDAKGQP